MRYIKFPLGKFHSKMTIFPPFFLSTQLLKHIGTTCNRLIIWETYHYFGSTKWCRLTFMDPYNFINCINIHFYKTSDAKKSSSDAKKKGANFQPKKNAGIILSAVGVFIAKTTWANQQVQHVLDQWLSIIFCHSHPRRQKSFFAPSLNWNSLLLRTC